MNTADLAYGLVKHAEEAGVLDDSEDLDADPSSADRRQKLRMALYGVGLLGAGGLAAWGLSGDLGKRLGSMFESGKRSLFGTSSTSETMMNPLTHGLAAGAAAAVTRNAPAGKALSDIDESGRVKVRPLPEKSGRLPGKVEEFVSATGLVPRTSPERVRSDYNTLSSKEAPQDHWFGSMLRTESHPPSSEAVDNVRTFQDELKSNVAPPAGNLTEVHKPTPPSPSAGAKAMKDYQKALAEYNTYVQAKQDETVLGSVRAERNPQKFVDAIAEYSRLPANTPMNAVFSGAFYRTKDGLIPVGATGMNAAELLQNKNNIVFRSLDPKTGVLKDIPIDTVDTGFAGSEMGRVQSRGLARDASELLASPTEKTRQFLIQQAHAPNELSLALQLKALGTPEADTLGRALMQSGLLRHYTGAYASSRHVPDMRFSPTNEARLIQLIRDYVQPDTQQRASAVIALGKAMNQRRYPSGVLPPIRRAAVVGGATAALSALLQTGLGYGATGILGRD